MTDSSEKYQVRICPFCGQPMCDPNDAEKYFLENKEMKKNENKI